MDYVCSLPVDPMTDISDSELLVMDVLWKSSPMRSGEIYSALASQRNWHRKTVNTLVRRLVDKGAIDYVKAPGGFSYSPLLARDSYRRQKATKLVKDLFDGEVSPLLAAFAETESLTDSDLLELRKIVSRLST